MLLARALGRTLAELGETLSAEEFALWLADYARSPWGPERADVGPAIVASTIANVHRRPDSRPFSAADFLPFQERTDAAPPSDYESTKAFLMEVYGG